MLDLIYKINRCNGASLLINVRYYLLLSTKRKPRLGQRILFFLESNAFVPLCRIHYCLDDSKIVSSPRQIVICKVDRIEGNTLRVYHVNIITLSTLT